MDIFKKCDKIYLDYSTDCQNCGYSASILNFYGEELEDPKYVVLKDTLLLKHDEFEEISETKHSNTVFVRDWNAVIPVTYQYNEIIWNDSYSSLFLDHRINEDEGERVWARYCFHIILKSILSPEKNCFQFSFVHQRVRNHIDSEIRKMVILADHEKIAPVNFVRGNSNYIKDEYLYFPKGIDPNNLSPEMAEYNVRDGNSCEISIEEALKICKSKSIKTRVYFKDISVDLSEQENLELKDMFTDIYKEAINSEIKD